MPRFSQVSLQTQEIATLRVLKSVRFRLSQMNTTLSEKYTPNTVVVSQWDVKWIITLFSMILIYGLIAIIINYLSIRFLVTRVMKTNRFEPEESKFPCQAYLYYYACFCHYIQYCTYHYPAILAF